MSTPVVEHSAPPASLRHYAHHAHTGAHDRQSRSIDKMAFIYAPLNGRLRLAAMISPAYIPSGRSSRPSVRQPSALHACRRFLRHFSWQRVSMPTTPATMALIFTPHIYVFRCLLSRAAALPLARSQHWRGDDDRPAFGTPRSWPVMRAASARRKNNAASRLPPYLSLGRI